MLLYYISKIIFYWISKKYNKKILPLIHPLQISTHMILLLFFFRLCENSDCPAKCFCWKISIFLFNLSFQYLPRNSVHVEIFMFLSCIKSTAVTPCCPSSFFSLLLHWFHLCTWNGSPQHMMPLSRSSTCHLNGSSDFALG